MNVDYLAHSSLVKLVFGQKSLLFLKLELGGQPQNLISWELDDAMHRLQHSFLLNQDFHAESHFTSFIKFLQFSHLVLIRLSSNLDPKRSAVPIGFSSKPQPCCSFTWKNKIVVITGEVFCEYCCHWNPLRRFFEMKKAGSRPIGGSGIPADFIDESLQLQHTTELLPKSRKLLGIQSG